MGLLRAWTHELFRKKREEEVTVPPIAPSPPVAVAPVAPPGPPPAVPTEYTIKDHRVSGKNYTIVDKYTIDVPSRTEKKGNVIIYFKYDVKVDIVITYWDNSRTAAVTEIKRKAFKKGDGTSFGTDYYVYRGYTSSQYPLHYRFVQALPRGIA